ncbi:MULTISPECIES: ABC transporter substrate-binding protein [Catenuloplanes]|uniref:Peptide/nickel transport system substrate-binding protein n=1 Tax=Catenuloplanes niger TaxID=587534 RepID=A0AAE4A109_9ACTN|nr:ABC transporter substrate-binding protein [Catenuloplanes niger]MDR7327255.1 peptide/nickel transport system substrate-binding protein [Catenuloplanes niger]
MRSRLLPAVILSLLLAACGSAPAASAAGEPRSGGDLVWAVETEPLTFNPHQYAQAKARPLVWNSFEALFTHDEQGNYVPWLATGIEGGDREYTIRLRTGVTFHDGETFDAAAVKANFDLLLSDGYNPQVRTVQLRNLKSVEVVDPVTVRLHLSVPDTLIRDFLTTPQGAQISPRSLRNAKNLKAGGTDVVGTGPFVLDSYTAGQQVVYRRNPAYDWAPATAAHTGPAYLDTVTYRFLKESSVRIGALTSGQVRVVEGVPATDEATIAANRRLRLDRGLNSGSAYAYYLNVDHAPFDDIRVRQAFREAVDVGAVLESVYRGTATRAWSVVSPSSRFYDDTLEGAYGGDAATANALLDAAGWTTRDAEGYRTRDGRRLTVRLVQSAPFVRDRREILAQAVQAAVKQSAGIHLDVRLVDQGTATAALNDGEYELFDNSRADTDAGAALNLLLHSRGAINRTHLDSPELDGLLDRGQATPDAADRLKIYQEVQRYVVRDQAVVLPLYAPQDQLAVSDTVGGTGFEPTAGVPAGAYDVWIGA